MKPVIDRPKSCRSSQSCCAFAAQGYRSGQAGVAGWAEGELSRNLCRRECARRHAEGASWSVDPERLGGSVNSKAARRFVAIALEKCIGAPRRFCPVVPNPSSRRRQRCDGFGFEPVWLPNSRAAWRRSKAGPAMEPKSALSCRPRMLPPTPRASILSLSGMGREPARPYSWSRIMNRLRPWPATISNNWGLSSTGRKAAPARYASCK